MAADLVNAPLDTTNRIPDSFAEAGDDARSLADPLPPPPPTLPGRPVEESPEDPQVASLRVIFPDFDAIVLQSVLESVNGDQDRAIDKLLGMSDPEYEQRHAPDQTELDEQFARQLMLEDHEQQVDQASPRSRGYTSPPGTYPGTQTSNGYNSRPEFREVTETFNKIAEGGKKTFNTIFSKVKAKMQELDQSRNDPYASSASGNQFPSGAPPHQQDRHTMMQQSYFDPNIQPYESQAPVAPVSHVQGYDLTPYPETVTSDSVNDVGASIDSSRHSSDIRGNGNPSSPPRSNIDPSKLGLLPKRPVSLINPSPPQKKTSSADDDLEYLENPFEEDTRHK